MDGTIVVWNVGGKNCSKVQTFDGHKKYVQGVAIDPLMKYFVSMSADCTVRVFKNRRLKNALNYYHKLTLKNREEEDEEN
mmetsp:Transcript_45270/g.33050  ORF Transcript_45270/g.33050 Transcript_45270/m.33050 type:complete len:80 (-) Transcript_45270:126-365(-)